MLNQLLEDVASRGLAEPGCDKAPDGHICDNGQLFSESLRRVIAEIKAVAESYKLELREYDLNTRQTDEVFVLFEKAIEIVDSQAQKIAEQAKELKLLRYVLDAEKTARIYEDGTGAAGEALFRARKELEEYDAKMNPEQTTDSEEVLI